MFSLDRREFLVVAQGGQRVSIRLRKIPERGIRMNKNHERVFAMSFAGVYPHYVAKAERKGRTKGEVDECIRWLTGYTQKGLEKVIEKKISFREFFEKAPKLNPNAPLIKGVVCGIRVEDIEDPLMQKIRWLDKLIDELAKGKKMEKILRTAE